MDDISYSDLNKRLESYKNFQWTERITVNNYQQFAEAGFYSIGLQDFLKCYECKGGLCLWLPGDDPWIEHAKYYPHCAFLRENKSLKICYINEFDIVFFPCSHLLTCYTCSMKLTNCPISKYIGITKNDEGIKGLLYKAGFGHLIIEIDNIDVLKICDKTIPTDGELMVIQQNDITIQPCNIHDRLKSIYKPLCAKTKAEYLYKLLNDNKSDLTQGQPLNDDIPSLNNLYKSDSVKQTIYSILSEEFDYVFDSLLNEAKCIKSLLVKEVIRNKLDIKEMYIQYGFPMENLKQLKIILDTIKEWKNNEDCDNVFTNNWDNEE
ncbi:baculoviral IAP repeat-containing protein 2-like [Oppia nitens]|uniref:baculoviral IAP repeat-containing protein 2-like n=1 Tax=Oppia nitens TaxID=1686743 RepID=UPI0023DC8ABA|nr:baculoviral IAP repeat-containing protein 2-like [Oppia nitens]